MSWSAPRRNRIRRNGDSRESLRGGPKHGNSASGFPCGCALPEDLPAENPVRTRWAFLYRSAIAKAASTVGIDHAQSRRTEIAAAATAQPTRKPISRRSELFSRSRSTGIKGRRGDVSSISDNTALVRLLVITAVETAFGKAKRSRAY